MSDEAAFFIGSRRVETIESKGIYAGQRMVRSDQLSDQPVPPIHAVTEDGVAACGEDGLVVFADATLWAEAPYVSSMRCRGCIEATGHGA